MSDREKLLQIEEVIMGGERVSIMSPRLDNFCNADGDLVIPDGNGGALVIEGWRENIRRMPS